MSNEYEKNYDKDRVLESGIKSCSDCSDCGDCDGCDGECGEIYDNLNKESKIRCVVMVCGVKGGIGKSSVSGILANRLRTLGYSVGILDANLSASAIGAMYGATRKPIVGDAGIIPVFTENGIEIISLPCFINNEAIPMSLGSKDAKEFALQFYSDVVWGMLDVLLIDCPSDTADVMQELINIGELDGVILVTDAGELSGIMAQKTANFAWINKLNVVGLVENYADLYEDKAVIDSLCQNFGINSRDSLDTDMSIRRLSDNGLFHEYDKDVLGNIVDKLIYISEHHNDRVYEVVEE